MTHSWTEEQDAIFAFAASRTENLIIEALAGAAKTSTLTELTRHLSGTVLCLAFNKRTADEMHLKMPPHVECRTLNSLGHRVWGQHLSRKLQLAAGKSHALTIAAIEAAPEADRLKLFESLGDILNAISGAKNHGHVPDHIAATLGTKCSPLLSDADLFAMLPEEYTDAQHAIILQVLGESFTLALAGKIDFADQLLMPTVMRCSFPIYSNVLVDEAQDLSELNHVMLAKVAKRRLIAVGDSLQAIYAFRGAHQEGMPILAARFNMERLYLSTTFRCPTVICDHVRHHATRINVWDKNPSNPGTLDHLTLWTVADIPDGSAVLCRNNAPLFRFAIRMLKEGRRPHVWGRDVAASLIKVMNGLGAKNMKRGDAIDSLYNYRDTQLRKLKKATAKKSLAERVECILVFLNNAESLGGAVALAESVFSSKGRVDLATGHKAKGAEWPDVYILDNQLLGDEGQELNLAYVMATRSQARLTYITSDGYVENTALPPPLDFPRHLC